METTTQWYMTAVGAFVECNHSEATHLLNKFSLKYSDKDAIGVALITSKAIYNESGTRKIIHRGKLPTYINGYGGETVQYFLRNWLPVKEFTDNSAPTIEDIKSQLTF